MIELIQGVVACYMYLYSFSGAFTLNQGFKQSSGSPKPIIKGDRHGTSSPGRGGCSMDSMEMWKGGGGRLCGKYSPGSL